VRIVATTVLLTGVVLAYGAHTHSGPAAQAAVNPVVPDARSIAAGRALYQERCVSCHGPIGLGDGPLAQTLTPPPADLRAHIPLHGDGQVFAFISGGFPCSAMPAYAGQLTDSQMWDLVNYLRTLSLPPVRQ
jgi:mono/diheme cytochrome c family protein